MILPRRSEPSKLHWFFALVFAAIVCVAVLNSIQNVFAYPDVELQDKINDNGAIDAECFQDHAVHSNRTNLFYEFFTTTEGIRVATVDQTGAVLDTNPVLITVSQELVDFSAAIHYQGDKVYLAVLQGSGEGTTDGWKTKINVYYMAVNEDTKNLDILNRWEYNTSTDYSFSYTVRKIDISVNAAGYVGLVTDSYSTYYHSTFFVSNSTTSFVLSKQGSLNNLFFGETGSSVGVRYPDAAIAPYAQNGFSVLWMAFKAPSYYDRCSVFVFFNSTTYINNGQAETVNNDGLYLVWHESKTALNYVYTTEKIDICNAHNQLITITYSEQMRLRVSQYDDITNNWVMDDVLIETYETAIYPSMFLITNDRESINLVYANSSNWSYWYVRKYNKTSVSFGSRSSFMTTYNTDTMVVISPSENEVITSSNYSPIMVSSDGKPSVASIKYENSIEWAWFYLDENGTYPTGGKDYPPIIANTTIRNINGEWLFEGEIYKLSFDTNNNTENGYIRITDTDQYYRFNWNVSTNRCWASQNNEEYKVQIIDWNWREQVNSTNREYNITFSLAHNIFDCLDQTFTYYGQNYYHNQTTTGNFATGVNIYNLGGFTMNRYALNDAGWYPQGDPLEVYAEYNGSTSWANTSQVYRKIQKFHAQFSHDVSDNDVFDTKENTGDFEIGLQYYNESSGLWHDLLFVSVDIRNGAVDDGTGAGIGKAFADYYCIWYARDENGTMNAAIAQSGYFSAYPDCGDKVGNPQTTAQLWVDLWIDKANNSRAIGGSISPYYYGMFEQSFLVWGTWQPLTPNASRVETLNAIRDVNGNLIDASKLDLVRVYTRMICGVASDTNRWSIIDFKNHDIQLAEDRYIGIDKPEFVEVLVVDMPSNGFLSGLRKAIASLGQTLQNALASTWKATIGAVDTILEFIGLPKGTFSSIVTVIKGVLDIMAVIMSDFEAMVGYVVTSITNYVLLIVTTAGRIVFLANMIVTTFIQFWQQIVSLFTGGWDNVGNIWQNLDVLAFVQLWLVAFFPFWEYERISKADNPLKAVKDDVGVVLDVITGIAHAFDFLLKFIRLAIDFVTGLF